MTRYLYAGINPVLNGVFETLRDKNITYELHKPNSEVFVNGFYVDLSPKELEPLIREVLNEFKLFKNICITPEDIKDKRIANIQMKNQAGLCTLDRNPENRLKVYAVEKL